MYNTEEVFEIPYWWDIIIDQISLYVKVDTSESATEGLNDIKWITYDRCISWDIIDMFAN